MKSLARRAGLALAVAALVPLFGPAATMQQAAKRPIEVADVVNWKTIGSTTASDDGQWFAYRIGPGEGDAQIVVRSTQSDKELKFDIGDPSGGASGAPGGGPGGGPGGSAQAVSFSDDSKWVAFNTYPTRAEAQRLRRQRRPVQGGVAIVNLATGQKKDYPKIRRFAFSGEASSWIALSRYPAQATPGSDDEGGGRAGGGRGGRGGAPAAPAGGPSDRPRGTDLILHELATASDLNVGNVADFSFSRNGKLLALTIDAQDKAGNGIQLRDMSSGAVAVLDSGTAAYERIAWTETGDGLAVLKGTDDRSLRDRRYAVLGFTGLGAGTPQKVAYDPADDKSFPEGMTISGNRDPRWTDDLQAITFGIHVPRPRDNNASARDNTDNESREGEERQDTGGGNNTANAIANEERVDLVLWHWLDSRLQSQQEVQEGRDRTFSYLAVYRADTKKFIRLADEELRTVDVAPKQRWAIGFDDREYELVGNLDGRRFQDVYVVDMQTGERRLAAKRARWYNGVAPDGNSFLAYEDGNYHVYPMAGGPSRNITQTVATSFVDSEDDHNVVKPPTGVIGWASDSQSVLLHDNWDIWQVPVNGATAVTSRQPDEGCRSAFSVASRSSQLQDRAKGIDLAKPQYFAAYGEWTKKAGIARVSPGKPGAELLVWDDAAFGPVIKAEKAERLVFAKRTATEPSDFYVADPR